MTDASQKSLVEAYGDLNRMLLGDAAAKLGAAQALPDPAEMMKAFTAGIAADGGRWLELSNDYYRQQLELWQAYSGTVPDAPKPAPPKDRRFGAPEWQEPYFAYLAQ